ncbi:MAG: phosphoglycerate kinase, partial [Spirochaetia bacterium]|nr:phosphoglycerate kinase [Spirochaetia bacterium]
GREEKSDKELTKKLAEQIDIFVNDSFQACALDSAIVTSLPGLVPSAAGMQLFSEIEAFDALAQGKDRPTTLLVGGVGLADKLKLIRKLIPVIDTILVAGGLPFTFLKSRAIPVGNSLVEQGLEVDAFQTLEKAELGQKEFYLPMDHVAAEQLSKSAKKKTVTEIPPRWTALDVGPKSLSTFEKVLKKSSFIFWYGPLGVIEMEGFAAGTAAVAKLLKKTKARVIVAGSETVDFVRRESGNPEGVVFCRSSKAALEYLARNTLPGVEALKKEA